ncbi:MAG: hypothetical protein V1779_03350 [bacterium]
MKYLPLFIMIFFILSCRNDVVLNDIKGEEFEMNEVKENYIVILGSGFCSDCMKNLIKYLKVNKKSYIIVYPTEEFNNLIKITMNTVLIKQNVDSSLIYWVEKEIYDTQYQNLPTPFVIDTKNNNILKYNDIFYKDGTVKKTFLN